MKLRGLVLAGGKSSRFGSDKALALYKGTTLLERAVSLLESLDLKPVVIGRRGGVYPPLKGPLLVDKLPDLGPLGGLYTALTVFKDTAFLILTCDMPALDEAALTGLLDRHDTTGPLTIYATPDGNEQPFPGIYGPALLDLVREKIKQEDLSMKKLFADVPQKKVVLWNGEPKTLCNINTQDQWKDLQPGAFGDPSLQPLQ